MLTSEELDEQVKLFLTMCDEILEKDSKKQEKETLQTPSYIR